WSDSMSNALFSRNVAALAPSATIAVSREAARLKAEGVNVVDLGAGEPDFLTPKAVCDAATAAIQAGKHKYAPTEGILELRAAIADLDRAFDETVKGLIINSPVNPTGAVYTLAELKGIAEWARGKGIWIIADEIYRRIHYGNGSAPSFLDLPDELLERVVVID